jgi:hypothetical protein
MLYLCSCCLPLIWFFSAGAFALGLVFQDLAKVREEVRAENAEQFAQVRAENAVSRGDILQILLNVVLLQKIVDPAIIEGILGNITKAKNESTA